MTAANSNYDVLLSTTMEAYAKKQLVDNVFEDLPLTSFLTSRGRMRTIDGGAKILYPLLTAQNSTVSSFSNYGTLDITPQEGIDTAEYNWKQLSGTVAISGLELLQNKGNDKAVIDLLNAKIKQTEMSLKDYMNSMLFSDGTGNSSKDFNGLANLVDATGTVGNIAYSAFSDWASYELNTGAARSNDTWTTAFNTVSRGADRPKLLITTQTLFEDYEASLQPQLRFTSNKEADAKFQNLMFSNAPVFWDADCTSGVTYFLNTDYLELIGMEDGWFKTTETTKPSDKWAFYNQIIVVGNLCISNRARNGKLTGQTV